MTLLITWSLAALVSSLIACGVASGQPAFRARQKAAFVAQLRRHLNFAAVMLPAVTCAPTGHRQFDNGSCFDAPQEEILLLRKELHVHNIRTVSPRVELSDDGLMRTIEVICKTKEKISSDVILGILPSKAEHTKAYVSKLKCYMLCEVPPPPGFWGRPPPSPHSDGFPLIMVPLDDPSPVRQSDNDAQASTLRVPTSKLISPRPRSSTTGAGEGQPLEFPHHRPPRPRGEVVLKLVSWLLFLDGDSGPDLEAVLTGGQVGCDCRLVVASAAGGAVTEVYLARSASVVGRAGLGHWDGGRLHWHAEGRFQRARDLRGVTMTCLAMDNWPFTTIEEVNGSFKIDGYIPSLWKDIEKYLNFSTKCILTKTNSEDDFENKIFEYGVDVGLTGVMASLETKEHSAVTTKLVSSWLFMVVRRRGTQAVRWMGFLRPFSEALWVVLLIVVAVLLVLLWPLHYLDRQPDAHFMLIAAFLQQAPGGVHRRGWFRILLIAAHLTTAVLVAGYSASLISSLASGDCPTVEDYWTMAASNKYHLHLVHGAKETSILTRNLHNIHLPPMPPGVPRPESSLKGFETHMHMGYRRALLEVCRHDHNVALLPWSRLATLWRSTPCPLEVVPDSGMHLDLVIPMRKDTPYLGIINYSINKLRQIGFFRRYIMSASPFRKTRWFRYESVAFDNMCVVLYFYMAAIIGSLVILLLEKCTFSSCCRRVHVYSQLNFIRPLH